MNNIIIRHDDFDFRMPTEFYIKTHEAFIKAGLTETLAIQWTQWGRISTVREDLVNYINSTTNIDIQLHGWGHFSYEEYEYDFIVRDLAASFYLANKYFKKLPTVWYTPWNAKSTAMDRAAQDMGIELSNESNDIQKFLRIVESEPFNDKTLYFHGWKGPEMELFPDMLRKVVIENKRRRLIKND